MKVTEKQLKKIISESITKILDEGIDFSNPNWADNYFNGLTDISTYENTSTDYDADECYGQINEYLENLSKEFSPDTISQALRKIVEEYNQIA